MTSQSWWLWLPRRMCLLSLNWKSQAGRQTQPSQRMLQLMHQRRAMAQQQQRLRLQLRLRSTLCTCNSDCTCSSRWVFAYMR